MDPNALRDHLTKLHAELAAAPRVDPGSHRLLGELMEDIQRLLAGSPEQRQGAVTPRAAADDSAAPAIAARPVAAPTLVADAEASLPDRLEKAARPVPAPPAAAAPTLVADADASLPDRLEKIALLFEVDHPTLAASSRRLIDLLGKVGL